MLKYNGSRQYSDDRTIFLTGTNGFVGNNFCRILGGKESREEYMISEKLKRNLLSRGNVWKILFLFIRIYV